MRYIVSGIAFFLTMLLAWGCSELQPGMPQDPVAKCEACHEMPEPSETHVVHLEYIPAKSNDTITCDACHKAYDTTTGWDINDSWHRNGIIDTVPGECDYCHDIFKDCEDCHYSPPRDDIFDIHSQESIRMHDVHAGQHAMKCDECHAGYSLDPKRVVRATHNDGDTIPVFNTYIPPNTPPEKLPRWNMADLTCNNLYCHGAFTIGGKTKVSVLDAKPQDSTQCGFCHDLTILRTQVDDHQLIPADDDGNYLACFNCHPDGYSALSFSTVDSFHIDGKIQYDPEKLKVWQPEVTVP